MADHKETYDNISKSIFSQIELLLNHIDENLKGQTITVEYEDDRLSSIRSFLQSTSLLININFGKNYVDGTHHIELSVFRIFPNAEQYELLVYLDEDSRLYQLIPLKVRSALVASVETASDIKITL